jgi:putative two-component system response regulator
MNVQLSSVSIQPDDHSSGAGPLILVVDDSRSIREFMFAHLTAAGFEAVCACDGRQALEVMQGRPVKLVISDIHMPVMDGKAFRAEMLANPRYALIPFVAMSTDDSRENSRRMRELRAAAFLTKPFKPDQLLILIERLLDYTDLIGRAHLELESLEKRMMLSSIMSLAQALDARDGYTRSHSDCVAQTAAKIVAHMGKSADIVEMVTIAGRLHDIGKVGIPDCVLQKPGRLTTEEYEIIKTHPGIGAKILAPIPSLAETAAVIHSHHERFDGDGYPQGLCGEAIPYLARVLALADVFDALTSNRPYRPRMETGKAIEVMIKGRGKHFCPDCLDAFLDII